MNKINQAVTAVRGFLKSLWNGVRKKAAAVAVGGVVVAGTLSAQAQSGSGSPDPTTIYSSGAERFNAAVGIAIGAIGIGAAMFFIRKGLKARM